ncbi:MAG: hypothetical protein ISN29_01615 [Gammaproteobacteria bacterium AqS3]|nr:hypothetical protein [Gammaproteobacteria bacterium AqS3]
MDISNLTPEPTPSESVQFQGLSIDTDVLKQEQIELGGKLWRIKKLLPIEGKNVLMKYVRPCLSAFEGVAFSEKANADGVAVPRDRTAIFFEVLGKFPSDKLEALSIIFMAKCVEYRDENGRWIPAAHDTGKAFMNLDPAELIILDAMAFMQNFSGSVSVVEQRLQGMVPQTGTDVVV